VVLPLIGPSVVGMGMFGFTLSWDEIARTSQAIGDLNTLPLELQGLTTTVTTPAIYALGTVTTMISLVVIALALGAAAWLGRRNAASAAERVPRRTLSSSPGDGRRPVYDAIYAAVIDRLPPGARLREEELAQTFAVSRTLVRQALHGSRRTAWCCCAPTAARRCPRPREARMCSMRAAWSSARWCAAGRRAGQGAGDGPEASRRCRGARHRGGRPPRGDPPVRRVPRRAGAAQRQPAVRAHAGRTAAHHLAADGAVQTTGRADVRGAQPRAARQARVPTAPPRRPPRCAATSSEIGAFAGRAGGRATCAARCFAPYREDA
jgi:hypothetical protein